MKIRCCGVRSVYDYIKRDEDTETRISKIPASCCDPNELYKGKCDGTNIRRQGCYMKYFNDFAIFRDRIRYILFFSLIFQMNLAIS